MMHKNGISYEGDVLELAMAQKIVNRSGAWFRYGETYLGQGKEKARAFLIENPSVTEEIRTKVMAAGGLAAPISGAEEGTGEEPEANI
jgi:recombination protein RecA